MSYKYQNVSDREQNVIGVGVAQAGEEIVSERPIENPNFKYVGQVNQAAKVDGVQQAQPGLVTEAEKIETKTEGN